MPALSTFDQVLYWTSLTPILLPLLLLTLAFIHDIAYEVTNSVAKVLKRPMPRSIHYCAHGLNALACMLCMVWHLDAAVFWFKKRPSRLSLYYVHVMMKTCVNLVGTIGCALIASLVIFLLGGGPCKFIQHASPRSSKSVQVTRVKAVVAESDAEEQNRARTIFPRPDSPRSEQPVNEPLPPFTTPADPTPEQFRTAISGEGITAEALVALHQDYATRHPLRFALLALREGQYSDPPPHVRAKFVSRRLSTRSRADQELVDGFFIEDVINAAKKASGTLPDGYLKLLCDERACQRCERRASLGETY
ncbi:unnamed protein product [Zymoseptoria tritici ST99CH_1A5]|uniref:Uncharacterized protein n=1 Tax=Zymoseptoria tritici ST99CH_1A5 TaxID=1276529 RepID=A0A1Y6L3Z1_ZYMTR|nr:unnamed protein product [Zymoseptoria tritici ST99CH_1A5]